MKEKERVVLFLCLEKRKHRLVPPLCPRFWELGRGVIAGCLLQGCVVRIKAVSVLHSSGKFHNSNNTGFSHPQDYRLVTFFLKTVTRVCEGKDAGAGCLESESE